MSVWGVGICVCYIAVGHRPLLCARASRERDTRACGGCVSPRSVNQTQCKQSASSWMCVCTPLQGHIYAQGQRHPPRAHSQQTGGGDSPLSRMRRMNEILIANAPATVIMHYAFTTGEFARWCKRPIALARQRCMLINLRPNNGGKRSARACKKFSAFLYCLRRCIRRRLICRPSGFTVGKVAHGTKV